MLTNLANFRVIFDFFSIHLSTENNPAYPDNDDPFATSHPLEQYHFS